MAVYRMVDRDFYARIKVVKNNGVFLPLVNLVVKKSDNDLQYEEYVSRIDRVG
jgi:hypothetical protein